MVTYSFHLYSRSSISFHSVFHSFHGLMNSINWPASSVWVFIAQLGEHCSANAEATGSNPVEAPKIFFSQLLKLRFTAMVTYSFHLYSRSSISFHSVFHSFHGLMNSINWPASSVWVFIAQLGEHCSANAEATGSNPVEAPKIFFSGYFRNCLNCDSLRWSHTHFSDRSSVLKRLGLGLAVCFGNKLTFGDVCSFKEVDRKFLTFTIQ